VLVSTNLCKACLYFLSVLLAYREGKMDIHGKVGNMGFYGVTGQVIPTVTQPGMSSRDSCNILVSSYDGKSRIDVPYTARGAG